MILICVDRDDCQWYDGRVQGFTKLHGSIIQSSIWEASDHVRIVWITMLALADKNGFVPSSLGALATMARVTRPLCIEAVETLLSPDPDSRTKDFEGRRIEEVAGGWMLINHAQYRDRTTDAQMLSAARSKQYRERRKEALVRDGGLIERDESRPTVTIDTAVTHHPHSSPPEAEAEAEAEAETLIGVCAPPPKKAKRAPPPEPSAVSIQAARYLLEAIRSHNSGFKSEATTAHVESMVTRWARDIDVGLRNDGMTIEGCQAAVDAAHRSEDPFWRSNLLSGKALRKHYETLRIRGSTSGRPLSQGPLMVPCANKAAAAKERCRQPTAEGMARGAAIFEQDEADHRAGKGKW